MEFKRKLVLGLSMLALLILPLATVYSATDVEVQAADGNVFRPATVTVYISNVKTSATVRWRNTDDIAHTTMSDTGAWDSGAMESGATFSKTFQQAGTFNYFCAFHGGMEGTVKVVKDTIAPVARPPVHSLVSNSTLGTSTVPVRIAWSATDTGGSGIARYQLQQSTNGGATFTNVTLPKPTATSIWRSLAPGTTNYRFRVRAYDRAGNASPWVRGDTFQISAFQETNGAIAYSGTWNSQSLDAAYGGSLKWSSTAGSKATFSFTGKQVAWAAYKGTNRGKAVIYIDGSDTPAATIDLYSSSAKPRRVVFTRHWSSSDSHTVQVRVLGQKNSGSSGFRVDVDAFVTVP